MAVFQKLFADFGRGPIKVGDVTPLGRWKQRQQQSRGNDGADRV